MPEMVIDFAVLLAVLLACGFLPSYLGRLAAKPARKPRPLPPAEHGYLQQVKASYALDRIDLEEFERRVELHLRREAGEMVAFPADWNRVPQNPYSYAQRITAEPGAVYEVRGDPRDLEWLQKHVRFLDLHAQLYNKVK